MSTICKLDPRVRKARTARRAFVTRLAQMAPVIRKANPLKADRMEAAALRLEALRKDTRYTGAVKNAAFWRARETFREDIGVSNE